MVGYGIIFTIYFANFQSYKNTKKDEIQKNNQSQIENVAYEFMKVELVLSLQAFIASR